MTLVSRVSAFFLGALAVLLAIYSVLLFLTAKSYLDRQFDEQLRASLNTLVAAVEVEDDDVKWEPSDHTVTLGVETGVEDVRWVVVDEAGERMDASRNLVPAAPTTIVPAESQSILEFARAWRGTERLSPDGRWRFLQYRLAAPHPKAHELRDPLERSELVVTVARATDDLHRSLAWLATLLVAAPIVCWTGAALVGRWFTRKALAPVGLMASAARTMKSHPPASDLRLPVGTSRDELAELAETFNGVLDRLYDAYDRQRRFAGEAAHQLRTPVTVLRGHADVALRRPRSAEEYRETLETVRNQAADLAAIIESMLFLARPTGDAEADLQEVDLGEQIVAAGVRWQSSPRSTDLTVVPPDRPLSCRAAPEYVRQIVDNLIGNAFQYSEPGTPVTVRAAERDGCVTIDVEDQGIGVREEDRQEIFRPFVRTEEARRTGASGTGLGLPIARRMAEAMGGQLDCRPKAGPGSRFQLRLPKGTPRASIPLDRIGERLKT